MELLISWASNRLIGEEDKNLTNVEPFRRQLLFFVDFGDPERSALPIMYETRRHCAEEVQRLQVKKTAFKYRDPLTGKLFSDVGSFQEIRKRENKKNEMLITSSFFSLELKLKKILRYITKHHLVSCVTGTNELTEYSSNPSLNREQNAPPAIASYTGLFECPEKEEETLISKKAKLNRINVFSTPAETQRVMEEGQSLSSNVIPSTEYVGTQEASSTKGGRGIVSSSFTKSEAKSINDRIEKRTNKREADITVSSAPSPVSLHRQPLRIHLTTPKTTMGVATPLGAPDTYGNSCAFSNPLRLPNTLPFGIPMDQSLYLPYNPFLNQYPYVKQFKDISCPGETLSPPCYPPADPFLFPNLMYLNSTSIVLPPSVSFPTPLPCFPLVSNPYAPLNPMNIPINYSTPYFGTPSPPSVSRFPLNTSLRQPSFNAHVRLQRPTATSFGRPHMQPDVNAFTRPVTQPDVDPFTRQ